MSVPPVSEEMSKEQQDRIANFRRSRVPDEVVGATRSISKAAPDTASGIVVTPRAAGAPPEPASVPPRLRHHARRPTGEPLPSAPHGAAADDRRHTPAELSNYILQLEAQNEQLRTAITTLSVELQARPAAHDGGIAQSEDEKKMFLNDILAQVEVVIQAHRDKTGAEILRFKAEADSAKAALRELQEAVERERVDYYISPTLLSFQRRLRATNDPAAAADADAPVLPEQSQKLLDAIADDILHQLSKVSSSDDVPVVVSDAVRSAFEAVLGHFTDELTGSLKASNQVVDDLRREVAELRDGLRRQEAKSEGEKVKLVQDAELELQALRDQLHAFRAASAEDTVTTAVSERALEAYQHMLVEARREAENLRSELENEKSNCAHVCLRLRAALQRRNAEFEKAVIERAEEVVLQHSKRADALRGKLEETTTRLPAPKLVEQREVSTQTSEAAAAPVAPSASNFVPLVLSALRSESDHGRGEDFERQVWRKTQELLTKYGTHQ